MQTEDVIQVSPVAGVRKCAFPIWPGLFRVALSAFNSQTKLRVGDTTRNQKGMAGKGEGRRFRAEIRLGDSGVRAGPAFFVLLCLLSIPKRNFEWETPPGSKGEWLGKRWDDYFWTKTA